MKVMDIFKGKDNVSYEMGRILWFLGAIAAIAYQGYAIYKGQNFDPLTFGGGFAALLAAGGFGIATKDKVTNEASAPAPINVDTVTGGITTETTNVGVTTS